MSDLTEGWSAGARDIGALVLFIWSIEIVNTVVGHRLDGFGIYPRRLEGLFGVPVWTLLHGGFAHVAMNTMPLLVMGFFVALRGTDRLVIVSVLITLVGGILVWCIGRSAFHVGASGLVFGYFGYLVALGLYERSATTLLVASFTVFYYGGLIFGILPGDTFVSWEGHLGGLLAGVLAARILAGTREADHETGL